MKRKKRPITLIEIMIVILLIGLIGGALAFNMRGSVDEGKAFKTRQNISRIEDILMLELVKGKETLQEIAGHWEETVRASPLVKGDDIVKDGWNQPFVVAYDNDKITIFSNKLHAHETNTTRR